MRTEGMIMARRGGRVTTFDGAQDTRVLRGTVSGTSASIAAIASATWATDVEAVEIVNQGGATIYYQASGGAATSNDLPILDKGTYLIVGPTAIANARLISGGGNVTVHFIERTPR
jgi:hypothetical protein